PSSLHPRDLHSFPTRRSSDLASYSPMPALIEAMAVERSKTTPSIRRQRPDVPWSLESILRKCLAPDPARRYQRAEQLADDLRALDRKSTRLNSSHVAISYAVF